MASPSEHENTSKTNEFKLENVATAFVSCYDDGRINTEKYIDAYTELIRFFDIMGTIFSFVTSDVNTKIKILQEHLASSAGSNYLSVESMIAYEVSNDITKHRSRNDLPSGSRTLLRLHRALAFIMALFRDLAGSEADESFSTIAGKAYSSTLAPYHTWLVRSAVSVALYAVPSRSTLIKRLNAEGDEAEIVKHLNEVVGAICPVYDKVQTMYADNNLLSLP